MGENMVSVEIWESDVLTCPNNVNIPAVYRGKRYIIDVDPKNGIILINIDDKEIKSLGNEDENYLAREARYFVHSYYNGVVKILCAHSRSGTLVIDKITVDLASQTATRTEIKTISLSWLTRWENFAHGTSIPPRMLLLPDWDNGYMHYIDIESGAIKDINLGGTGYENEVRFSHKFFARHDDIYMAFGKHLAGSNHELLKVFSVSRHDLGFSTGGGSPRPQMFGLAVFSDKIFVPVTSGGVVGADNDLAILDETFSQVATIDIKGVTGISVRANMPFGNFLAKSKDGGYYIIIGTDNGESPYEAKCVLVKFDSNFNLVTKYDIFSFTYPEGKQFMPYFEYSDITSAHVVDIDRKKVYIYAEDINGKAKFVEIDISDIWDDIEEFNARSWIIGKTRIPTILTISVAPI